MAKSHFTVLERLLKNYMPVTESGCWIWMLALLKGGYGRIKIGKITKLAHRVAYELLKGPIPDGLEIDHLCRVRCCINPNHLEPVSYLENIRRGEGNAAATKAHAANQRAKTQCPKGHLYNYISPQGKRACSICRAAAVARHRAK